jgi:thiamine-monophosphate kinase
MTKENLSGTRLSLLGEFGLIERLTSGISTINASTVKGAGDDAAVIDSGDSYTLISTDLLVENIHFDRVYTPMKHLGYKAAVVNFSDIYAMNGTPEQITVGIAVSSIYTLEALEELYSGIRLACEKYGVDLVGGDTTSSASGLFLSVTVIGSADKDKVVYRNTASEHDLICVSGDLGAAYLGLLLLEREKTVFLANPDMQPDLDGYDYLLERQLKPEAARHVISTLSENSIKPTAMIDISDGLASEILHICKASAVGCCIYEDKLPIDPQTVSLCEEFNIQPVTAAMNGGEDYELLLTISQQDYEKVRQISGISVIGHITHHSEGVKLISKDGSASDITAQGWDALLKKD